MTIEIPWGSLGYPVYKRTYARKVNETQTEEFPQTIDRVLKASQSQLKCNFTDNEIEDLRLLLLSLKGSVAGRFLWQLGTKTVKDLGLLSLQNCCGTVINEPIKPFTWTMDALMLGCGVGYNIQKEYVYELPRLQKKKIKIIRDDSNNADFIVPDKREGWIRLLKYTLQNSFFDGESFSYSTHCIRPAGKPIVSFGGISAGAEPLAIGIERIVEILNNRVGKKLRPIDCLDILNLIGKIVVSGNVRRSAAIALGDMDDLQFLSAKDWKSGTIPNWRAMSNNSVVCNDINLLPQQFWDGYLGSGEPYGLINMGLARSCGRIGDTQYPDENVSVVNPCSEQFLSNFETCCLAEVFLPNISSKDELIRLSKYLYRINKHSLTLKCHHEETQKIIHKNMRMGIGISGYLQATEEQKSWLNDTYTSLREYDKEYSKENGFNESIKLTTIKPSGTLSLLPGITPGCHPGYAHHYIRRMRVASNSDLIVVARNNGYHIEYAREFDGSEDRNTMIISFPCSFPKHTVIAKQMTSIDQLEVVKDLQKNWSDNAVSCTIYYRLEELDEIKKWLKVNYNDSIKSVSFLLKENHGFDQAPLEEITEEEYQEMISKIKPITSVEIQEDEMIVKECEGGVCPTK